jgi:hypothetical protein
MGISLLAGVGGWSSWGHGQVSRRVISNPTDATEADLTEAYHGV